MIKRSPPKHRHDGTSPLPLGMDWSPPPRKWNGKDTVWPHGSRTGWSYCVTIPSWSLLPTSRNADPVVFYRVQVGVQSPEGNTTLWGVLRRFNDFLKLYTHKNLPPAPAKGLMRLRTRALLDERRLSLEEWLTKLLSDIDVSRSVAVASFLELEAAARASKHPFLHSISLCFPLEEFDSAFILAFQDVNQHVPEKNPSGNSSNSSAELHYDSSHLVAGLSSLVSDYGSDTAYETSEHGTGLEYLTLDDDSTSPIETLVKYGMTNLDEGLFMGETLLEQLEGFPKYKGNHRQHIKNNENGFDARHALVSEKTKDLNMKADHSQAVGHTRKLSVESVSSDVGSIRGCEISDLGNPIFSGNGSINLPESSEDLNITNILSIRNSQLILPLDQRQKLNRYLTSIQRRLGTARTDMEELITRLDQEIAVKEYLATKVKDIEGELESTRQKSKENLQAALLLERERYTQMQWDMEELKRKSVEMEIQLKLQQGENLHIQSTKYFTAEEKDALSQELVMTEEQLKSLQKRYEDLELKSKADIKVLVKEVKLLRSSQKQLKEELNRSVQEKANAQRQVQEEKLKNDNSVAARRKLLDECKALQKQLQECNNYFLSAEEDKLAVRSSSVSDALDLLTASDTEIGLLIGEAQRLGQYTRNELTNVNSDIDSTDDELRTMLTEIFTESAKLRQQLNWVTRRTLKLEVIKLREDP
uniref:PX domain-containing protein n=1 Tax=Kalanchoe fedtschenkoi TaxID=63787 RepID=A0A7N0ZSR9_KALFE